MKVLPEKLVTRRLVLRPPTERDIPEIVREVGNWNVAKWLGRVPHPYVPRHARVWLRRTQAARPAGQDLVLAITLATRPDRLIGTVGCHGIATPRPVIGYWLAERHWGKGYASEAVAAVLRVIFEQHPGARPTATSLPDNRGSIAVLLKSGFRRRPGLAMNMNVARGRRMPVLRFVLDPTPGRGAVTS